MSKSSGWNKSLSFVLYVLSFFLLWEWLRPVEQLTDTSFVIYFVLFAGLSLGLHFLGVNWKLSGTVKILFIFIVLQRLYFDASFLEVSTWLPALAVSIWESLILTVQQDWNAVSNVYRSLLFFVLLWLTAYLLHYWIAVRKQLFLFYVFTVFYVALLDTFSPYDGQYSIVRIILIGFLSMGLLTLQRLLDQERLSQSSHQIQKWIIPLVLMVAFSSVAAYAAPKAEPIWPDPVPFIQSFSDGSGSGSGVNRLGYGVDDSSLGGSFIGDDTKVFDVVTEDSQYWRIEMKDVYTGKGWENSASVTGEGPGFGLEEEVPFRLSRINEESEEVTAVLDISLEYNHLVYPYHPVRLESGDADEFIYDLANEKITSFSGEEEIGLESYEWTYKEPQYSLTALRETTDLGDLEGTGEMDQYLQLPDELPERVSALAEEITADHDNWYDKANAIESYFSQNAFTYDQSDIPVPGEGQDYVDQFLFETQRGYCDNFSTSMVVMLRAVDIPARWVKGYTGGEVVGQTEDGLNEYEVTNNNAHSWVEVYFPSLGWVPFEPTIGFTNNVSVDYDLTTENEESDEEETPVPEEEENEETPAPIQDEEVTDEEGADENGGTSASFWQRVQTALSENIGMVLLSGAALLLAGVLLFRMRFRWMPRMLILYYSVKKDDETFSKAYLSLLKQLHRFGLKRNEDQTLRAYAKEVDRFFSTKEMSHLTSQYERILYRKEGQQEKWQDMRELWENLIKRTTG
ncbi:transglutaminase domain-containing protein [Jeotgalibacillus sp. ET6]|uniref:transglutaminase TgpA family protein n=1 Tax=Jeotgalibacillus sp. ET6 TaxID=3037260 RepID=UPI00241849D2|nr:transglutaminaseTgpA domain-containing protein [Jeotgalibacillus sp. ET6]MDG5473901.1 transglutaminase domain-containing protein [Jeotgalibacillus sp. ET6]